MKIRLMSFAISFYVVAFTLCMCPLMAQPRVALLDLYATCSTNDQAIQLKVHYEFLNSAGIQFDDITKSVATVNIRNYDLLIITRGYFAYTSGDTIRTEILKEFVETGGTILAFTQSSHNWTRRWLGSPLYLGELKYQERYTYEFMDLSHPLFQGFNTSSITARAGYTWFRGNTCHVAVPYFAELDDAWIPLVKVSNGYAVAEMPYGKGHYILSNLPVEDRFNREVSATKYIENLLQYTLSLADDRK